MNKLPKKPRNEAMYKAILTLKDVDECMKFFDDLCTVSELRSMEQRYEVASMLMDNKVYMDIMEKSNASSATISRENRMLNYGTGCLPEINKRTKEAKKENEDESSDR